MKNFYLRKRFFHVFSWCIKSKKYWKKIFRFFFRRKFLTNEFFYFFRHSRSFLTKKKVSIQIQSAWTLALKERNYEIFLNLLHKKRLWRFFLGNLNLNKFSILISYLEILRSMEKNNLLWIFLNHQFIANTEEAPKNRRIHRHS